MAQYRGTVQGGRGQSSRLGHKSSGLETTCNGWDIGCTARIYWDYQIQSDVIEIRLTDGSGDSYNRLLFRGNKADLNALVYEGKNE